MKFTKHLSLTLFTLAATPAFTGPATSVPLRDVQKDDLKSVTAMKSYYSGAVTIFALDGEEPAARPMEVVIVTPNGQEEGGVAQRVQSAGRYCSVDLEATKSTYDEERGLTLAIPVTTMDIETGACANKDTLILKVKMTPNSNSHVSASRRN